MFRSSIYLISKQFPIHKKANPVYHKIHSKYPIFYGNNISVSRYGYNMLLKKCAADNNLVDANALFQEMEFSNYYFPIRDTYNSFLSGCLQSKRFDIIPNTIQEMKHKYASTPDIVTYNILISCYALQHNFTKAKEILDELMNEKDKNLHPDARSCFNYFNPLRKINLKKALDFTLDMETTYNVKPNAFFNNGILHSVSKSPNPSRTFEVFDKMLETNAEIDTISFNIVLETCVSEYNYDLLNFYLEQMDDNDIPKDSCTYNIIIKNLCKEKKYEAALQLLPEIIDHSFTKKHECFLNFIHLTGDSQQWNYVNKALNIMENNKLRLTRNIYNSLISNFGKYNKPDEISNVIKDMNTNSVLYDKVTYGALFKAYGNTKDNEKLIELYTQLKKDIRISPTIMIYTIILTSFVDCENFDKIRDVLQDMKQIQMTPNEITIAVLQRDNRAKEILEELFPL